MIDCFHCGAKLDVTMAECPTCGAEVEMGRLTGILGVVCRGCDAYNEPGTRTCVACGRPLAGTRPGAEPRPAEPPAPAAPAAPPADPFAALAVPLPGDLPPLDLAGFSPAPPEPPRGAIPPPAARPPPGGGAAFPAPGADAAPAPPPAAAPPAGARAPRTYAPAAEPPAPPSFFGELELDLPVHWTAPQGGSAPDARPATPARAAPAPGGGGDETQPILLVTACPSCGGEAGAGSWCASCGQALGPHHTRVLSAPAPLPGQRTPSQIFGPMEPGKASLVLERGEGFDGATFRLAGDEIGAGRSRGGILFPGDWRPVGTW